MSDPAPPHRRGSEWKSRRAGRVLAVVLHSLAAVAFGRSGAGPWDMTMGRAG